MKNIIDRFNRCAYLKNPIVYYVLLPILLCLLFGSLAFSNDLWLDEIYTITEIHLEPLELWTVFATESHPPFYFYALKTFCTSFGDSILVMKLFSVLGCLATMLLGAFPIRRAFGDKTALWFMFLCLTMPFMMRYAVEIRMYSWAIFFVTAAMIYAIVILQGNKPMDWGLYFIFGLLGAYTHLYALMAIAILHLLLGGYFWFTNRNRYIQWFLTSLFLILGYLPWIPQLLSQVSRTSEGFWIAPLSFSDIIVMPASLFYLGNRQSLLLSILLIAVLTSFGCLMLYRIYSTSAKGDREIAALACVLIPVIAYGIAIIFSITVQPVIISRYLMVMAGLGILFLAIFLSTLESKKIIAAFCILMLVTTCVTYGISYSQEYPSDGESLLTMTEKISQNIPKDCILLHVEGHAYGVLSYYMPDTPQWNLVSDEKVENLRSTYIGKLHGSIVGIQDVYSAMDSGRDLRLITFEDTELPDMIIDNFNVVEERHYTSTSPIYPIWCISSIERLSISS